MMLTSEVLPEPERPKRAVTPPSEPKAASIAKEPTKARFDLEPHAATVRRAAAEAMASESIRAAIEMTTEITARRIAPASPPGTCRQGIDRGGKASASRREYWRRR